MEGIRMNILKKKIFLIYYRSLSTLYNIRGEYEKAIICLNKVIENKEDGGEDWCRLGCLLGAKGNWLEAKQAFIKAVSYNDKNYQYLYWLGKSEESVGNCEKAAKLYDEALNCNTNYVEALLAKGNFLMNKGKYKDALLSFANCINIDPFNPEIYNSMGLCQMNLNNNEIAEKYFKKAIELKPDDFVIRNNYGVVLLKRGCYEKAIEQLNKIKEKEKSADIVSSLAYCYGNIGKYDRSIEYYIEAIQLDPHDKENLINLACIYAKNGESKKSLSIFKKLIGVNPYDTNLLNNIAWVYENSNNYKEAEENYYRGLALTPNNPYLIYNLICCFIKQNVYSEAIGFINKLKDLPEWSSTAWSSLAQIYEKLGANNLAVDCYNRAFGLE